MIATLYPLAAHLDEYDSTDEPKTCMRFPATMNRLGLKSLEHFQT
jgi:hypothetical protein